MDVGAVERVPDRRELEATVNGNALETDEYRVITQDDEVDADSFQGEQES
jgi:hypothetical protein